MGTEENLKAKYPLRFGAVHEVWDKLKVLERTGWLQWDIEKPETVYDHICSARLMAATYQKSLDLSDEELRDLLDILEIHDWPEALVGDGVILGDEVDVDKLRLYKQTREIEAMRTICQSLEEGEYIFSLYNRYAYGSDDIARLAKQIEKLQAVFKAVEYENKYKKKGLVAEFVHYTKDLIHNSFLQSEMKLAASRLVTKVFMLSVISSTIFSLLLVLLST